MDTRIQRHRVRCCAVAVAVLLIASCSGEISASTAREKTDAFVRSEFSMDDLRMIQVDTVETSKSWIITYSAKGGAVGGPVVVDVDKKTGRVTFLGGGQ